MAPGISLEKSRGIIAGMQSSRGSAERFDFLFSYRPLPSTAELPFTLHRSITYHKKTLDPVSIQNHLTPSHPGRESLDLPFPYREKNSGPVSVKSCPVYKKF